MPQMAPMSWMILFLTFVIIFMWFNLLNYFSFMYKPKFFKQNMNKKSINWKW